MLRPGIASIGDESETLSRLAADLQRLRVEAGGVSYGEIAERVTRRRRARGMNEAAAHVGRSSVYDVFRAGRSRMNPDLVEEIALALGCSDDDAAQWRTRCVSATARSVAPHRTPRSSSSPSADSRAIQATVALLIMAACVGLNLFGHSAAGKLSVLLYLDMIGTALAAILLGPWRGAAVGAVSSALAAISNTPGSLAFIAVQVVGALVWGYGVRAWRMGRTRLRYLLLNVVAALACSLTAVPVIVLAFGGLTEHPADSLTSGFAALGEGVWAAVFSSNIPVSIADKVLAGAIAVGVLWAIRRRDDVHRLIGPVPAMWWGPRD